MTAAVVGLRYARRELTTAKENTRIDLAFRLYEHEHTPEFVKHIAMASDFLTLDCPEARQEAAAQARWRRWQRMSRQERGDVILYLNHLEVVAGLYEMGRLDENTTMRLFGGAAAEYWRRGSWFIERLRAETDASTFDQWEMLARGFREQVREEDEEG